YSRARDQTHYPNWVKFNREVGSNGDIGIWHETFLVRAGEYEAIYNNMPLRGLAKASQHVEAVGRATTAIGRLGRTHGTDAPAGTDALPRNSAWRHLFRRPAVIRTVWLRDRSSTRRSKRPADSRAHWPPAAATTQSPPERVTAPQRRGR